MYTQFKRKINLKVLGFKILFIVGVTLLGCQSTERNNISNESLKKPNTNQTEKIIAKKGTKTPAKKKPTAQQTANVIGIAAIAGALVSAAKGDTSTAINILDAGSKVIKSNTPQTGQSNIGGSGNLATLNGNPNAINLSGKCGFSKTESSESARRLNYNEIAKVRSLGGFQTDTSLKREVDAQGVPSGFSSFCSAAGAQVRAIQPSYNQAIISSNTLVNGQPLGLTCSGNQNSSAQTNACLALQLKYTMQAAAFACHYSCDIGK